MTTTTCTTGALLGLLDCNSPAVLSVAGCGGKTTLINTLAQELKHRKVLVAPTTKIRAMRGEGITLCTTAEEALAHVPQPGIQCMGMLDQVTHKLTSLPLDILAQLIPTYDLSLLEADGSKCLPCKGWRPYEPVVPEQTTHMVGIITLRALGRPVSSETVFAIPEFTKLTGLEPGDTITPQALLDMVCHPNGLFRNSVGREILLIGSVEDAITTEQATDFLQSVHNRCPNRFITALGSAKLQQWQEVLPQ